MRNTYSNRFIDRILNIFFEIFKCWCRISYHIIDKAKHPYK
jgi:hypothetical protein